MQGDGLRLDPAQIAQDQGDAAVEKGELAQPVLEGREIELGLGEGLGARQKGDLGAGGLTLAVDPAGQAGAGPTSASGASGTPSRNRMNHSDPPRKTRRSSRAERPLTTETPTPCSPPETL